MQCTRDDDLVVSYEPTKAELSYSSFRLKQASYKRRNDDAEEDAGHDAHRGHESGEKTGDHDKENDQGEKSLAFVGRRHFVKEAEAEQEGKHTGCTDTAENGVGAGGSQETSDQTGDEQGSGDAEAC